MLTKDETSLGGDRKNTQLANQSKEDDIITNVLNGCCIGQVSWDELNISGVENKDVQNQNMEGHRHCMQALVKF